MNRKTSAMVIVIVGAVLLGAGVFLPLVKAPLIGTFTLIGPGEYHRAVMFVPGVIALVLALLGHTKHALWPGLVSLGAIGFGFYKVQESIDRFQDRIDLKFGDGALGKITGKASQLVELQIGWAVLVLGAVLIIAGGALAWRRDAGASVGACELPSAPVTQFPPGPVTQFPPPRIDMPMPGPVEPPTEIRSAGDDGLGGEIRPGEPRE